MPERAPCEICGNEAEHIPDQWFPGWRCPRCGDFDYDRSLGWRKLNSPDEIVRLSGWVREQNAAGIMPVRITPELAGRVLRLRMPGLRERANRALVVISKQPLDHLSFQRIAEDLEIQGKSYSQTPNEVMLLIEILVSDEYINKTLVTNTNTVGYITAKGMIAAEDLRTLKPNSTQGFVAMWFHDSLRDTWLNGFDPGIRAAGFRPVRIDTKEYIGGVSDEIMAEIRRSRFVVADYTGHRNGVYFEAGFALGLGLTVIPSCRADEVDKLHFDIAHLNTLVWKTPSELADRLNRRIRAVIGAGPDASDPA